MPKRKGRGRPKGSRVQKKVKESADDELAIILDSPFLQADLDIGEEQEAGTSMTKKKGRGRPKRLRAQNCQESVHSDLNNQISSLNIVEKGPTYENLEDADMFTSDIWDTVIPEEKGGQPAGSNVQNCRENADFLQVSHGYTEEPKTDVVDMNHEQTADYAIVTPKKKGRGLTRGLKVQMKRQQSADGKLDVSIHPTRLVPVGPGRNDFITDLSVIVRKNARLNVYQWRQVPKSTRDAIVKNVLDNWRLPDTDMVHKAILREAGRLYQNWRIRIHEHYLKFGTKEEALKHVPNEINESDWKFMVDYFSSPSYQIISAKNKANRAKLRTSHTCGTKSFQAVSYDARDPVTGKEPDLQTLWQLTHKKANGEWVDEASKEINDKVAKQIIVKECQLEDSQDGTEVVEPEIISAAFKTVVGRKSYVFGDEPRLRSSNFTIIKQLQAELDAQKRETDNARKECNELSAALVEVRSRLEEERRKREEIEACLQPQAELNGQKRAADNARKECNKLSAALVEAKSQLEEERRKREEVEARLLDRQKEMQEINNQVQTAIQSALSQHCLPPTEAAESSTLHKKKIAELEAQLHEAEDVITDIRSELIKYRYG